MNYSYCVVIVTYNRLNLLKECLEHAIQQTVPPSKIVVVNNCSTDGTYEYLNEQYLNNPIFCIDHEDKNFGGSGGFYRGIEIASQLDVDWIMLIDDDAILDFKCMELLNPGLCKKKALAYACKVICNGEIDTSHRRYIDGHVPEEKYDNDYFECTLATFCGLMFSSTLIKSIGYPKKEYFIWFDDSEYCMRIVKETPIVVVPKAYLNHKTVKNIGSDFEIDDNKPLFSWKSYYGLRNSLDAYKCHHYYIRMLKEIWRTFREIRECKSKMTADKRYQEKKIMLEKGLHDGLLSRLGVNQNYLPGGKK